MLKLISNKIHYSSLKMRYVINDIAFDVDPREWPIDSTFYLMYEGDPHAHEFSLNNSGMTSESIRLIVNVITKDVTNYQLFASDINWNDLVYTTIYLGLGVSVDFIYPLLLTIEDRIDWYKTCETRLTHICDYPDASAKLSLSAYVFGGVEEEEDPICVRFSDMKLRDSDYDIVGENAFRPDEGNQLLTAGGEHSILDTLTHIPNLFVAGGYALALFDIEGKFWSDIDIFAYGDSALKHIKEGVEICIELANTRKIELSEETQDYFFPVRTRYSISVPIPFRLGYYPYSIRSIVIQFILIKSISKYQILNRFDLDASCIGFDIGKRYKFYSLPRFVRAFETKTNVTDPTRQSPTYIRRLIKYAGRGFNIAVPGFELDKIKLSSNIMKLLTTSVITKRNRDVKSMNLIGLQGLVTSALTRSNMSTKQPTTISGKISDYAYVNTENVRSIIEDMIPFGHTGSYLLNKGEPINFVVGDILNECYFSLEIGIDVKIGYVPKYPIIELVDNDPQNGMIGSIHQVKSSFYGEYYGIEQGKIQRSVLPPRKAVGTQTSPLRRPSTGEISTQTSPTKSRIHSRRAPSKLRVISKPRIQTSREPSVVRTANKSIRRKSGKSKLTVVRK